MGELSFQLGEEVISGFSSRKEEALLVYLAVEKKTIHRRENLFTQLWPGMPESSARNNLRQPHHAALWEAWREKMVD